jgi:hypothetical protein
MTEWLAGVGPKVINCAARPMTRRTAEIAIVSRLKAR